jgi:CRISPR/Cas system-associated exonuclease Cas4 (RecB family)
MKREFTHSELATYQDCPQKWLFKYAQKLAPQRTGKNLAFGKVFHSALAAFYLAGLPAALDLFQKEITEFIQGSAPEEIENLRQLETLGISMLSMYAEFAKAHDDFEIVEMEVPHTVPIITAAGNKSNAFEYTYTCDQLVRRNKQLWIHEFKTAEIIDANYISNLVLDEQMSRYQWATEKMFGEPVAGSIYTILRKKMPNVPEILKKGGLTQRKDIDTTHDIYLDSINRNGLNPADYAEILEILRAKGNTFIVREPVLRNERERKECEQRLYTLAKTINTDAPIYKCPSRDCTWKCDYRSLCIEDTAELRTTFGIRPDYHPEHSKVA